MPSLRTNAPGTLVATAETLRTGRNKQRAQAYALVCLAKGLQTLMSGGCTLDEFRLEYAHETSYPIDPDKIAPR